MAAYSEYLVESELRSSSQLLLALGQEFEGTSADKPSLSLELELPIELRDKDLLPLRITSQLRRFHGLSSRLAMTLSPRGDALRDLTASLAWRPTSNSILGLLTYSSRQAHLGSKRLFGNMPVRKMRLSPRRGGFMGSAPPFH